MSNPSAREPSATAPLPGACFTLDSAVHLGASLSQSHVLRGLRMRLPSYTAEVRQITAAIGLSNSLGAMTKRTFVNYASVGGSFFMSFLVLCLTGCAWASRNVYHEPESGDVGSIVIVNHALPYRSNVWLYNGQGVDGTALTVFDATAEKSIKATHRDTIVLSLNLVLSGTWALGFKSSSCKGVYEIPFRSGDLQVVLDTAPDRCSFSVFQRDATNSWEQLNNLHEWTGELRSHA